MTEVISIPVAATELKPYTFVRITPTGADVAVPPDTVNGVGAKVDGVVLQNALPLVNKSMANIIILGVAKVKLATGETPVPGDLVAPDANGYAVVDNTYGVYKVIRQAGEYVDIILK
jgi:hypothetical protein